MSSKGPGAGGRGPGAARVDALELEAFQSWKSGKQFARFENRVRAEHNRATLRCMFEADEVQLRRAQGAAAALASVLAMPEQILAEMRAGKKAGGE